MLYQQFNKIAKRFPERNALIYKDKVITYQELQRMILQFSVGLGELGVKTNSTVALLCPNSPEYIVSFYSVAHHGAQLIPINPAFQIKEISRYLQKTKTQFIITDQKHLSICESVINQLDKQPLFILIDNTNNDYLSFYNLFKDIKENDTETLHTGDFIFLFSSGSTGRPKLLNRSQENYLNELEGYIELTHLSEEDSILCAIPLFHSHGIGSCLLPALGSGASLVVLEQFSPPDSENSVSFFKKVNIVLELIRKWNVTIVPAIPYIFRALVDHPASTKESFKGVRYCFSSGNFLPEDVYKDFYNHFGIPIRQIYGCSEAGGVCMNITGEKDFNPRSVGQVFRGISLRIVDENDKDVLPGIEGEIYIKSKSLSRGYIDRPELNKVAFRDGYFRTGDLGKVNQKGEYTITGRKKLLIDTGGNKVDPFEIEDFLLTHPKIKEVVVVGIKGLSGNELVKAAVVLSEECTRKEILEYCRENLASYKIPRIIEFRASLPKSAVGKILRSVIIEEGEDIEGFVEDMIARILARGLKVKEGEDVDVFESFESFGIDSSMILELNIALEEHFGTLPSTLFFENQNIYELVKYLLENHEQNIEKFLSRYNVNENIPQKDGEGFEQRRKKGSGETKQKKSPEREKLDDIAIIGLWGRYPESPDLQTLWKNLCMGRDCIKEIPRDRWKWEDYYNEDKISRGTSYSKWGGFLDGVDEFDADLFNITPREAELIDPQERIFLETVWATLEDAGYSRKFFLNNEISVGVFVGVMWGQYQLLSVTNLEQHQPVSPVRSNYWSVANRVSYFFNLKGPSMTIDTACSSSLTAIHLSCESIKRGECSMALAGGVNLSIHPMKYILMSDSHFASTDGRCRSFGDGGDGYVPGEGSGAVLLKPLEPAEKDGDHIYGVIKGSFINHCGKTNGFTVPNPIAQETLIRRVLENAGIKYQSLDYIEAHGTGTDLGDPIEMRGLCSIFKEGSCPIGSIKSNIGHLEAAAGIAGITKVLLQMRHHKLVPSLYSKVLNKKIDFDSIPFIVQQSLEDWKGTVITKNGKEIRKPLLAGISSFGAGGSNAHVIIEEYITPGTKSKENGLYLIPLSARTLDQVKILGEKLLAFLKDESCSMSSLAYTLQTGREELEERAAFIVKNSAELIQAIDGFIHKGENAFTGSLTEKRTRTKKERKNDAILVESYLNNGKLEELAKVWVKGIAVPWARFYSSEKPRKISLPIYSFKKESYWLPINKVSQKRERLHPLLDMQVSDFEAQKFITSFQGNEFFFTDHVIDNRKVLPGVVYLEMARVAAEFSWKSTVIELKDIIWSHPFIWKEKGLPLETRLYPKSGYVLFQILSSKEGIYVSGKIYYKEWNGNTREKKTQSHSFKDLINHFKKESIRIIRGSELYEQFKNEGYMYGPRFRGIQKLYCGENTALARISFPLTGEEESFVLHPSLLDVTLQSVKGIIALKADDGIFLPFSLGKLNIVDMGKVPEYVWVELNIDKARTSGMKMMNLYLLDNKGNTCLHLEDFSLRLFQKKKEKKSDFNEQIQDILSKIKSDEIDVINGNNLLNKLYINS